MRAVREQVSVLVPLEVADRVLVEDGDELVTDVRVRVRVREVQHPLVAPRRGARAAEQPVGVRAGEVGVGVDHLGLDPQAELHAAPHDRPHERVQPARPHVRVVVAGTAVPRLAAPHTLAGARTLRAPLGRPQAGEVEYLLGARRHGDDGVEPREVQRYVAQVAHVVPHEDDPLGRHDDDAAHLDRACVVARGRQDGEAQRHVERRRRDRRDEDVRERASENAPPSSSSPSSRGRTCRATASCSTPRSSGATRPERRGGAAALMTSIAPRS